MSLKTENCFFFFVALNFSSPSMDHEQENNKVMRFLILVLWFGRLLCCCVFIKKRTSIHVTLMKSFIVLLFVMSFPLLSLFLCFSFCFLFFFSSATKQGLEKEYLANSFFVSLLLFFFWGLLLHIFVSFEITKIFTNGSLIFLLGFFFSFFFWFLVYLFLFYLLLLVSWHVQHI